MSDVELDAQRIKDFLNDEVVQSTLRAMKETNYRLFLGAKDEAGRASAQAQAVVLEGFAVALQAVVDSGERARIDRERGERSLGSRPI